VRDDPKKLIETAGTTLRPQPHENKAKMSVRHFEDDPLYLHLLLTAEKKFWRCISFGEPPRLFGEPTLETR
jgi:hypothetical protein